ncbi:hypothetical protein NK8_61880 (plasmid) [Caballeronia sp. NK8]|uniref:hypothetical protein n=1 Tax=Caballeronia sp. NK8 TaxID=140098 RepID=UPI001BB59C06|nr:hypothetical protein [Caballeronia sp. NK8]BCQ27999.1 hypothetical protein NK8_61880 [Caballeronia sp. NK8]
MSRPKHSILIDREFLRSIAATGKYREYADDKLAGLGMTTINRKLNQLRGLFTLVVDTEMLIAHPMEKIRKMQGPSGIVRYLMTTKTSACASRSTTNARSTNCASKSS